MSDEELEEIERLRHVIKGLKEIRKIILEDMMSITAILMSDKILEEAEKEVIRYDVIEKLENISNMLEYEINRIRKHLSGEEESGSGD